MMHEGMEVQIFKITQYRSLIIEYQNKTNVVWALFLTTYPIG